MSNVYCLPIKKGTAVNKIVSESHRLLAAMIERERVTVQSYVPMKVHFGEPGNTTFIPASYYNGLIQYLQEAGTQTAYIETNVLYKSPRTRKDTHLAVAAAHGFTQVPVIIADGDHGEDYIDLPIHQTHFQTAKIARLMAETPQLLVVSHFKGHMLAGFGGAIKQLAMGCAARGGKLDQHAASKPQIKVSRCIQCGECAEKCPVGCITIPGVPHIDQSVCIGCASCSGVCPQGAIEFSWLWGEGQDRIFFERLAEYAYAAQLNKPNLYFTFALNVATGCDCEGHPMQTVCPDIGLFAGTDPVAMDQACVDLIRDLHAFQFPGQHTLDYAEAIGLGTKAYSLITL